jgi:RNA polymerase sigma-70 factor (ECF subfamily)
MQEISFRNDILPLKDKLYRLAFRITLNSAEAEDVVQDTMIRVWNKRDHLRMPTASPTTGLKLLSTFS